MRLRSRGACAGAVIAMIAIAGCGGDDSTTDSSTSADGAATEAATTAAEPGSTEEFVAQANAICAEGNQEIDEAAQEAYAGAKPTEAEMLKLAEDVVIPAVEEQVTAIGQLPVPEGDEDQVAAILDAAEKGLDEAKADPAALTSGKALPFAEANRLASEYGMTACGG